MNRSKHTRRGPRWSRLRRRARAREVHGEVRVRIARKRADRAMEAETDRRLLEIGVLEPSELKLVVGWPEPLESARAGFGPPMTIGVDPGFGSRSAVVVMHGDQLLSERTLAPPEERPALQRAFVDALRFGLQRALDQRDAYREGAAEMFGVPYEQVTKEQRQAWKERTFTERYASPVSAARMRELHRAFMKRVHEDHNATTPLDRRLHGLALEDAAARKEREP